MVDDAISIHAPRGGSDVAVATSLYFTPLFQSTLPVGERQRKVPQLPSTFKFQSTLPVGGATSTALTASRRTRYFNPRSPWGGATGRVPRHRHRAAISIHAPRGGSDVERRFNTLYDRISIHAPRGGERQQRCTNFSVHLWREIQKREKMEVFVRENCTDGRNKRRFCTKSRCEPTGSFLFA